MKEAVIKTVCDGVSGEAQVEGNIVRVIITCPSEEDAASIYQAISYGLDGGKLEIDFGGA